MNLKTTLIAVATTLALSASAATFSPGNISIDEDSYDYGSNITSFEPTSELSFSQNIYPAELLSQITPQVNLDGSRTIATITSIEIPFYVTEFYGGGGELVLTAHLTPYNDKNFPLEGTKSQWIDYSTSETVSATATFQSEYFAEFYGLGSLTIPFDTPFEYEGGGFVLTLQSNSSLGDYWNFGSYSFSPKWGPCSALVTGATTKTGNIYSTNSSLSIINITYDTAHKEAQGGGEVVGEPDVFKVGNYDTCSAGTPSLPAAYLPITGDHYDYSYAQVIYTETELNGLCNVTAEGVTKADITDLTFKLSNKNWGYHEGSFSGTVYIQNYDGTAFPKVNDKPQWIEYDNTVSGSFTSNEFNYDTPEEIEVTATFKNHLRYEGGSILVTFVADCSSFSEMYGSGVLEHFVFKADGQAAVTASDNGALDNLSGDAVNVTSFVPVLKLGYTPVTVAAAVKPVLFENVKLALNKVALDPTIVGWGGAKEANSISISFDLVNAEANGIYDISLGTTKCGTLTGTHGVVNFVGMPQNDLVLAVTPQAEGGLGGSTTIALSDLDALFPVPTVEVAKDEDGKELKAAYAEYTVWENPGVNNTEPTKKTGVQLVAKFQMGTSAPVAVMKGTPTDNQVKTVTEGLAPDCFADFTPNVNYSDYAANDGYISYYLNNVNVLSANISKGEIVNPNNKNITVNFSMDYPLVTKSTPVLSTTVISEVTSKDGFDKTAVNKKYNNGASYSSQSCTATFNFAEGDPVIVTNVTYPDNLVMYYNTEEETADFYAPFGHVIHINWTPKNPSQSRVLALAEGEDATEDDNIADIEWTPVEGQVYSHPTNENGTLWIKTKDAEGNDSSEPIKYIVENGTVGIESIAVDAAAPAEYFDLMGRRVNNPSTGIYILRQGHTVKKVVL